MQQLNPREVIKDISGQSFEAGIAQPHRKEGLPSPDKKEAIGHDLELDVSPDPVEQDGGYAGFNAELIKSIKDVEDILGEGQRDIFLEMPPEVRKKFKEDGERSAREIVETILKKYLWPGRA